MYLHIHVWHLKPEVCCPSYVIPRPILPKLTCIKSTHAIFNLLFSQESFMSCSFLRVIQALNMKIKSPKEWLGQCCFCCSQCIFCCQTLQRMLEDHAGDCLEASLQDYVPTVEVGTWSCLDEGSCPARPAPGVYENGAVLPFSPAGILAQFWDNPLHSANCCHVRFPRTKRERKKNWGE